MAAVRARKRAEADDRNRDAATEDRRWYRQLAVMDEETRVAILASRMNPAKTARQFGVSPEAVRMVWREAEDGEQ
jgi:hypothetical protein